MADLVAPTSGRISVLGGAPQAARAVAADRLRLPGSRRCSPGARCCDNVSLPLEVGGGKALPGARSPQELLALVGLDRLGEGLSARTVRRHAPAGGDRPRAGLGPAAAADGRAVRRARRDHARPAERGAAAALGDDRHDHRVRHPLDLRGGVPRPERAAAGGAAGPGARAGAGRPCRCRAGWRSARRRSSRRSPATCAACWRPADGRASRPGNGRAPSPRMPRPMPASSPTSAISPGVAACCRSARSCCSCCCGGRRSCSSTSSRSSRRRRSRWRTVLVERFGILMTNLLPTAIEAVCGFVLGNIAAIALATVFVYARRRRRRCSRSRS